MCIYVRVHIPKVQAYTVLRSRHHSLPFLPPKKTQARQTAKQATQGKQGKQASSESSLRRFHSQNCPYVAYSSMYNGRHSSRWTEGGHAKHSSYRHSRTPTTRVQNVTSTHVRPPLSTSCCVQAAGTPRQQYSTPIKRLSCNFSAKLRAHSPPGGFAGADSGGDEGAVVVYLGIPTVQLLHQQ